MTLTSLAVPVHTCKMERIRLQKMRCLDKICIDPVILPKKNVEV